MKIVILEKEEMAGIGGVGIHNKRLKEYLSQNGHSVFIIRFTKSYKKEDGVYGIPYHLGEERSFIIVPSEKSINLLKSYLTKLKPDIVHFCVGISPLDLIIPSICHDLKIPIVGIWHGDIGSAHDAYSLLAKSIFLAFLPVCRQLDNLIVFSEGLKDFYNNRGVDKNKLSVIPNGINTEFFKPGPSLFKKKYSIKNAVVFLGRITLVKDPRVLIESFLEINPPDTKLIIVGTGDLLIKLKNNFKDDRIIFTGLIKDEKTKLDILRAGNIFVLPSRFEGMSLALLEAMSTGLACITTDVGNNGALLKNAGITIPASHLKTNLTIALKILMENKILQKSLGLAARKKVVKYYSQTNIMPQYLRLYEKTIAGYKTRGCPQSKPIEINMEIRKKLNSLWQKAKKLGETYLFSET